MSIEVQNGGEEKNNNVELSRELLSNMMSLHIEVKADFSNTLDEMRAITGANLQPRPEGYHITVIGPSEYGKLKELTEEQIKKLKEINDEVSRGEGIIIDGVGFVDGSIVEGIKEADVNKKTAFLALDIPKLADFRKEIGLETRYFHITLGYEGGDIHMKVVGREETKPGKFKDKLTFMPKVADKKYQDITIPELRYGGLSGDKKQEKKK